ncbi:(2Fe-2S) ferredoxin domain-containing protein [Nocardioides speluncae]|uniref:(2Fe-2S) ferredoxin domain-containing protein n=1 Tax=Nocardioides speluncae TaxID=2670337 RepID=UPI001981A10B|nr:(2Fe-2S) ferredoxin domain-containing protein [Nocardioides speluncae]
MSLPTVTVCRDCCCGSRRKHPDVDHDGQLEALRTGLEGAARVVTSGCLLACEDSNVVVVSPSPGARNGGARPVWLSSVLTDAAVSAIVAWVRAGGPGTAPLPGVFAGLVRQPPALTAVE